MLASMNVSLKDLLTAWEFYPGSAAVLLAILLPYTLGWLRLKRNRSPLATTARLISFTVPGQPRWRWPFIRPL